MAIKVTLRKKLISKGRHSLYLDFYPPITHPKTGKKTRREFLGMYINIDKDELRKGIKHLNIDEAMIQKELIKSLMPLTPIEKKHNQETLKIAQSIRQQRENALNKPEVYNEFEKERMRLIELGNKNFIKYFQELADKRNDSNRSNWNSALKYLKDFAGESLKFSELNEAFFERFKEFLLTCKSQRSDKATLSTNSAVSYFNKVKAALKQAYKDGSLVIDLNSRIQPIKAAETRREYLTLEELNQLVKTPCNDPLMKRAALFSALTGLRFSDIQKMTWSEMQYIKGQGYFINFSQKKTKGEETLPISEQAYSLTNGEKDPKEMHQEKRIFEGLKYSAYQNKHLFQWVGAAGITKDITFHCFRHTYATLQLFNGTDIYTVSKMLGHKDLKTTQVYAKIVDEAKREAAEKIKLNL